MRTTLALCYKIVSVLFLLEVDFLFFFLEIYRQKLQLCVADGELDEEDVAALLRLRVLLCIPKETVEAAHTEICGSLFEKVTALFFLKSFYSCMR